METKEEEDKKEEAKENKEVKKIATISRLMTLWIVVAALFFVFGTFTIVSFKEQRMLMFTFELSPLTLLRGERVEGWVIGNRVLETEYGEIILGHWSKIWAEEHKLILISQESFQRGRAIHNLTINGIDMPRDFTIRYNRYGYFGTFTLYEQQIIIYGIPFRVDLIFHTHMDNPNNLSFTGHILPESSIILTDTTQISFMPFPILKELFFISETKTWILRVVPRNVSRHYFLVKHPSETEFQRYTSITFGQHWGNFIEGVLFEGTQ